jgi:hypothetical protein
MTDGNLMDTHHRGKGNITMNDKLLAELRKLQDELETDGGRVNALATAFELKTILDAYDHPSPTPDDLAEAAQSVATQQRDLVDRLRVDPADLRQEVRHSAAGEAQEADLPAVAGDMLTTSLADFERRCQVHLAEEQSKPLPDNALIGTLCEAVRLSREFTLYRLSTLRARVTELKEARAGEQAARVEDELHVPVPYCDPQYGVSYCRECQHEVVQQGAGWVHALSASQPSLQAFSDECSTLRAQVATADQALHCANTAWREAVRQRDARIVELEAQLAECAAGPIQLSPEMPHLDGLYLVRTILGAGLAWYDVTRRVWRRYPWVTVPINAESWLGVPTDTGKGILAWAGPIRLPAAEGKS